MFGLLASCSSSDDGTPSDLPMTDENTDDGTDDPVTEEERIIALEESPVTEVTPSPARAPTLVGGGRVGERRRFT